MKTSIEELYGVFLSCGYKVSTDSRSISGGEIFFALKGENFDGDKYAPAALEAGAAFCVVSEKFALNRPETADGRLLPVEDTLKALQQMAALHRNRCLHDGKRIAVLALTGTNGKTTTKELIKAVLASKYNVLATEGNLNNSIGVPLTVLKLRPEHEIAIVEMGASHPGDIKELVDIAQPDCGLITNVGRAHLLGFGSFEGVKRSKGELYDYLASHGGYCFVNEDSSDLQDMAKERFQDRYFEKSIRYGSAAFSATPLPSSPERPCLSLSIEAEGKRQVIDSSLVGSYNAANILTAIAVGRNMGVSTEDCISAIEAYVPRNNRSQITRTARNTLVVDAYNANPSSMDAALENFKAMEAPLKMLCLGDMLELGEESLAEHVKMLRTALGTGAREAIFVGKEFKQAIKLEMGPDSSDDSGNCNEYLCHGVRCHSFTDSEQAAAYLDKMQPSSYLVLIKGSRGIRMEKLIPSL